jgi:hypothetical protein
MSSDYDAAEFVDGDFQAHRAPPSPASAHAAGPSGRAPTPEEMDSKVTEAHQRLVELKRAQEELERERAGLEETRRRQRELQAGRQEMVHNLTRGVGLLKEAEFNSRRDAEQMAKALVDLRDALAKIEAIHEDTWNKDNFDVELTRALTALENARMEWNSARLKFPLLAGPVPDSPATAPGAETPRPSLLAAHSFSELCRLGLALTWPLAVISLLVLGALLVLLFRR